MVGFRRAKNAPKEIIDKLNQEINAGLADLKIKTRLAELGATALRLAADFGQANRRRTRSGQGDKVRGHQTE